MTDSMKRFWRDKLINLLHDPPEKVLGISGHASRAMSFIQDVLGGFDPALQKWTRIFDTMPDTEAASTDRAVFSRGQPKVRWLEGKRGKVAHQSLIIHPLTGDTLELELPADLQEQDEWFDRLDTVLRSIADELGITANASDTELREAFQWLWRNLPKRLIQNETLALGEHWMHLPADSRNPDHSIWDHTRMASAWVGGRSNPLREKGDRSKTPPPWLLMLKVGSAQAFIGEARKTRDLWVGSYLLADLTWFALEPIIELLGLDAILYPSLFGNPLADQWLHNSARHKGQRVLDEDCHTMSSMLPNKVLALVPEVKLEELVQQAQDRLTKRWQFLVGEVKAWIEDKVQSNPNNRGPFTEWREIFDRQLREPPRLLWSAVPWEMPELVTLPDGSHQVSASSLAFIPEDEANRQRAIWQTYAGTPKSKKDEDSYLKGHRGYLYPAVHHEVHARLAALGRSGRFAPLPSEESGLKCSVDGWREVLRADVKGERPQFKDQRNAATEFWKLFALEGEDPELLSGMSAFRRYLMDAEKGAEKKAGRGEALGENSWERPLLKRVRLINQTNITHYYRTAVPFPSTWALAAGVWYENVLEAKFEEADVAALVKDLVAACEDHLKGERTQRIDGYPALERIRDRTRGHGNEGSSSSLVKLLRYDAQWLHPNNWELRAEKLETDKKQGNEAKQEAAKLREVVKKTLTPLLKLLGSPPPTHFAILRMDGDSLGKILLGTEQATEVKIGQLLHPVAKKAIEDAANGVPGSPAGTPTWVSLFEKKRLMAPALHAFMSRALAHFAYEVVPWLVEKKYHGRLVYAGGDDVLAFVPAGEALELANDLRQHYSASYLKGDWRWERRDTATGFEIVKPDHGPVSPDTRIVPMMGKFSTISGAVVMAHAKTPLQPLVRHSQLLLDDVAKGSLGRDALVVSQYTRGGEKRVFGAKWGGGAGDASLVDTLEMVRKAFGDGESARISSRLPYLLQTRAEGFEGEDLRKLVKLQLNRDRSLKGRLSPDELIEPVAQLIDKGRMLSRDVRNSPSSQIQPPEPFAGLLIARFLALELGGEEG